MSSRLEKRRVKSYTSHFRSTSPSNPVLMSTELAIYNLFNLQRPLIDGLIRSCIGLKSQLIRLSIIEDNRFVTSSDPFTINIRGQIANQSYMEEYLFSHRGINYEHLDNNGLILFVSLFENVSNIEELLYDIQSISSVIDTDSNILTNKRKGYNASRIEYQICEMRDMETAETIITESTVGAISYDLIAFCPPGIPLLFPGEVINQWHVDRLLGRKVTILR